MNDSRISTSGSGQLARLEDLGDYQVADGEPDVRGWTVKSADGQKAGKVDSLIVDTSALKVRYLGVALDRKALNITDERTVLVSIADARLDDDKDEVLLGSITAAQLAAYPLYPAGTAIPTGNSHPRDEDARQFYGNRGGTGGVQRTTLSEEELRVGTRQKQAGQVNVHKTVETRHVSEKVPVSHEEVTVERHAVSPNAPDRDGISEGEIRIPLMSEEAVVEKHAVANEEVVIRKQKVAGEQTVEADLKRERLEIDRSAKPDRGQDRSAR